MRMRKPLGIVMVLLALGTLLGGTSPASAEEGCGDSWPAMLQGQAFVTTEPGSATLLATFQKTACAEVAVVTVGMYDPASGGYLTVDTLRIDGDEEVTYYRVFPAATGRVAFALGAQEEIDGELGAMVSFGTIDGYVPEPDTIADPSVSPTPVATLPPSPTSTPTTSPSPAAIDLDTEPTSSNSTSWLWIALPILGVLLLGAAAALAVTIARTRASLRSR